MPRPRSLIGYLLQPDNLLGRSPTATATDPLPPALTHATNVSAPTPDSTAASPTPAPPPTQASDGRTSPGGEADQPKRPDTSAPQHSTPLTSNERHAAGGTTHFSCRAGRARTDDDRIMSSGL